jgi:ABC-2 type transport system ATP-binding protein
MDVERVGEANEALVKAHVPVLGIASKTVTLEDLFLTLTGGGGENES